MTNRPHKPASTAQPAAPGRVYLVGAGPGAAKLITLAAIEALKQADVVVRDALASPALLDHAAKGVLVIEAGKRAGHHTLSQDQINATLAEHALAGRTVVRLKGGDPFVFGRGSEEAAYLDERGIEVVAIPGITAAIAGPAYAGIPVTHRHLASTVTFITGHEDPDKTDTQIDYASLAQLAQAGGTLCFYMGMGRLQQITDELTRHGLDAATPVAVVQWGTLPHQRTARGTLNHIAAQADEAGLAAPAIIVVGKVAGLEGAGMHGFEQQPLLGKTIVVTRTRQQASGLRRQLEALGAAVIEAPTIAIEPPEDDAPLREAIDGVARYDWLLLTSENAVAALSETLDALGHDARHMAGVRIATVGDATGEALRQRLGIVADFAPDDFHAEALARELIEAQDVSGKRFIYPKADIARRTLIDALTAAGAAVDEVDAYRTVKVAALPDELWEIAQTARIDWLTFTSSSSVRNFVELAGDKRNLLRGVHVAAIGPRTSETANELGLPVTVEAKPSTIAGLVEAIVRSCG